MMNRIYTEIANAPWMFIYVGITIAVVLAQCVIYMRKAWTHARVLGLENNQIKKGLITGIQVSIIPSLPVLIVLFSLIPLLGAPLPWLRLSVIGSAMYESMAAGIGVQAVGEEMVLSGYTVNGWIYAAWVMTFGASMCVLWAVVAVKPVSSLYEKVQKFDVNMVLAIGSACMASIMAYVTTIYGVAHISTGGIVFGISFVTGAVLIFINKKLPKQRWIKDFNMAISMIVAMVAACIIF